MICKPLGENKHSTLFHDLAFPCFFPSYQTKPVSVSFSSGTRRLLLLLLLLLPRLTVLFFVGDREIGCIYLQVLPTLRSYEKQHRVRRIL